MWKTHYLVATSPEGEKEYFQFNMHQGDFSDPIEDYKFYLSVIGVHEYDDWTFEEIERTT